MTSATQNPDVTMQRSTTPVSMPVRRTAVSMHENVQAASAFAEDTENETGWGAPETKLEIIVDMFWSRRNVVGSRRSRKEYRTALRWQAAATLPLFPPLGFLIIWLNICFGLRPKATRVGFLASLAVAVLFATNMMFPQMSLNLAALR